MEWHFCYISYHTKKIFISENGTPMTKEGDGKHWIIQSVYNSNNILRVPRYETRRLRLKYQTQQCM